MISYFFAFTGLLFSFSSHAETITNCNSYTSKFSAQNKPCEEVFPEGSPTVINGKKYRFFHYTSPSWSNDSPEMKLLMNSAKAVHDSIAVYQKFGKLPPIYFYLSNIPNPDDDAKFTAFASANPMDALTTEPCPVTIYPAAVPASLENYSQILAHEIFHCFQGENFRKQLMGPYSGFNASWNTISNWWVEGSANYFSNLVYPSTNFEYKSVPFYKGSIALHLQENAYSTDAFFQSMGNMEGVGPDQIINLFNFLPQTGTSDTQRKLLSKRFILNRVFHQFSRDFITGQIADSGGGYLPTEFQDSELASHSVEEGDKTYDVHVNSFQTHLTEFELPVGGKATFAPLTELFNQGYQVSVKVKGTTNWLDLTFAEQSFDTSCDDSKRTVEVLVTSIKDSAEMESIPVPVKFEKKECPCKTTTLAVDSCLIGKWRLDNSVMKTLFVLTAPNLTYISTTGTVDFIIDASRKTDVLFTDWNTKLVSVDPTAGQIIIENIFSGLFTGELGASSSGKVCVLPKSDNTSVKTRVTFSGKEKVENTVPNPLSGGGGSSSSTEFSCSATKINYDIVMPMKDGSPLELTGTLNRIQ